MPGLEEERDRFSLLWRCVQVFSAINMSYYCLLSVWPGPRGLGALKTSLMIGMCLSNSYAETYYSVSIMKISGDGTFGNEVGLNEVTRMTPGRH